MLFRSLTCGFAGGLNPDLAPLALIFSDDAPPPIRAALERLGARAGKFHCAPRIAVTAEEKRALFRETHADAVEMESAAIHAVCAEEKIPCVTLRVISDTASEDLPLDFNRLTNAEQELDFAKLAWAVASSPGKIPALLRLQKRTAAAALTLAETLGRFLTAQAGGLGPGHR